MELRAIAVSQRRSTDDCDLTFELNLADSLQLLAQNLHFALKLKFVRRVLIVAATAQSEQRTRRRHALGRRCQNLRQFRMNAIAQLDARALPGEHKRHQHHASVDPSEAFPAVNPLVYLNVMAGHRLR